MGQLRKVEDFGEFRTFVHTWCGPRGVVPRANVLCVNPVNCNPASVTPYLIFSITCIQYIYQS